MIWKLKEADIFFALPIDGISHISYHWLWGAKAKGSDEQKI